MSLVFSGESEKFSKSRPFLGTWNEKTQISNQVVLVTNSQLYIPNLLDKKYGFIHVLSATTILQERIPKMEIACPTLVTTL